MSFARPLFPPIVGLIGFIAIWHCVSLSGFISQSFLPTPARSIHALWYGLTEGDLLGQARDTILRMLAGWLLASLIGIGLGVLLGVWATARLYLASVLEFVRPLPASAIIPVAIALFGLTPQMVIGVIAFGSLWPTLLATVHGFAHIEPRLKEVAQVLAMSRWAFIFKMGLPNAAADILAGMRLSLTVALVLAVVGEMLTGQNGLGTAVLLAGRSFQSPDLYAGIMLLGAIGLVTNTVLLKCEQHILRWRT